MPSYCMRARYSFKLISCVGRILSSDSWLGSFLITELPQAGVDSLTAGHWPQRNTFARILARVAVLLLLISVGGLETLAKVCGYLPESNPSHYLSAANKINLGRAPVILAAKRLPFVAPAVPPPPIFNFSYLERYEEPQFQKICLTTSLRHRSPPSQLPWPRR